MKNCPQSQNLQLAMRKKICPIRHKPRQSVFLSRYEAQHLHSQQYTALSRTKKVQLWLFKKPLVAKNNAALKDKYKKDKSSYIFSSIKTGTNCIGKSFNYTKYERKSFKCFLKRKLLKIVIWKHPIIWGYDYLYIYLSSRIILKSWSNFLPLLKFLKTS